MKRSGLFAILAVGLASASMIQALGWNQTAHFALVKSFADGSADIDRYQWETGDKSYTDGHFYSAKAPGLAMLSLPAYSLLDAAGADGTAARVADSNRGGSWQLEAERLSSFGTDGSAPRRTARVARAVERQTPLVWAVGLFTVVLPGIVLLLLVRNVADRVEPGYGAAAAVALGVGTLMLPFSTLFFSHVLSIALGFGAFALLWREREGSQRLGLVAAAGALSGLAVVTEYPLALLGAVLGIYAIARPGPLRRGLAYAGGVVAGVLPLAAFNVWAFGSVTHLSYDDTVAVPGRTGHDRLGLNDTGTFGLDLPSPGVALDLLLAPKGLLTLTPVLLLGALGAVAMSRRGRRAEAAVVLGAAVAYLAYVAGYYLPFGGGSPGPRFLVPMLPFLAVPLSLAFRRWPGATVALFLASAATMTIATAAEPLLGGDDTGRWTDRLVDGDLQPTVATALGAGDGWLAIAPFLAAIAAAVILAARSTPARALPNREVALGAGAALAWAGVALAAPPLLTPASGQPRLVLAGAAASLAGLALLALTARARRPRPHGAAPG